MGDNREYVWTEEVTSPRPEYQYIASWVKDGARVVDLGCGEGALLRLLKKEKNIKEFGIEIAESGVKICQNHGLQVRSGRIDVPLTDLADQSFEVAVCNVTLQMVSKPEILLQEMKRIARYQIISFPNFAFLLQRLDLLFMGRMPRRLIYGYSWYSTGHIHQLSIKDFKLTANDLGLKIIAGIYLFGRRKMCCPVWPNMLSTEAIFLLEASPKGGAR
jgi:methionine biosynthesis protein MetW